MSKKEGRKIRSDKKRDVQPTIPHELKDCIYRLSYITDTPIKDVAERLCIEGMKIVKVKSYLSRRFRRTVRIDNALYLGDMQRPSNKNRTAPGTCERITIRFKSDMHESLSVLAYAMDCSVARACALLLDAAVREVDFINEFIREYISTYVDAKRMIELKKVLQYINSKNPFEEEISWAVFLSHLMKEVKISAEKLQDNVTDFIVKQWNSKD